MVEIKVPDIGDFDKVPVIEVFVAVGDTVAAEDPLIAVESDKATMEIPAPKSGVIKEISLKEGDEVSQGDLILLLDVDQTEAIAGPEAEAEVETAPTPEKETEASENAASPESNKSTSNGNKYDLVVLGSGPGGYTAAFRAADLGLKVALVERYSVIGGVCLNVGCIPSKALLHAAKVIDDARESGNIGVTFSDPSIDIDALGNWKNQVVTRLTGGLTSLSKQRKVTVVHGLGKFSSANEIEVQTEQDILTLGFDNAIIAVGSTSVKIPGFPHDDPRVIDSTGALELSDIPKKLLIVGGGIIGLEMATVYRALGSEVSVVEMMDHLMAGADIDVVRPLLKIIKKQYENIWTSTKVSSMTAEAQGIRVNMSGENAPETALFDKVLVAVGRKPNGSMIAAEAAGVQVNDTGFIDVDNQMRTNIPHIFAIGDVVGQPMLAHKAVHEGKVAAEVAAGMKSGFEARVIPSVAYTDPEIAWVGMTETEAKEKGVDYEKGIFPWAASGRALSQDRSEGMTKLLFDPKTDRIIGAAITGINAGDLIAEAALAIEMNADASDLALTIHAHPTVAETIGFAAEAFEGTITDLYMPKKASREK